jgi:biopolymer transport protein ExbB
MNRVALQETLWATWDYLVQGGWVMVPMVIASVAMWALILERLRTYHRLAGKDIEKVDALWAIDQNALPDDRRGLRATVMRRFLAARTGRPQVDALVFEQMSERMRRTLNSRLAIIGVLAAIAPLLGLLGTVLGMIQTFEVISVFGTSNARAMAGGISVALITTQTGLIIAIPGLFISGSLSRRAARLESALDEFTLSVRRVLKTGHGGGGGIGPDGPPRSAMEASAS